MNKALKIIIIIAVAIILLLVIASVLAGPIAKNYVNKNGEKLIGRKMDVQHVGVNIITGRVKVHGLQVYEEDKSTKFAGFDTLDVSVALRKLLHQEVKVRHLTLTDMDVHVSQMDSVFNFSSIIDHFGSDEEEETDTTSSPWKLGFYKIRLSRWQLHYADLNRGSHWDIKNINIVVPGVYFDGSRNTDAGVSLQMAEGGELTTAVQYNMGNNDLHAELTLDKIDLANAKAFLEGAVQVGKMEGELNAHLFADGNLSDITNMKFHGTLALNDVDIHDQHRESILECENLDINVNKIILSQNIFDVQHVKIDNLEALFELDKDGNTFSRLIPSPTPAAADTTAQPAEQPAAQASTPSKPMQLSIGELAIKDAAITYNDHTLPDKFHFPVRNINITANNISTNGESRARLSAKLPHNGFAAAEVSGTLGNLKQHLQLTMRIKNVQLKDLSPYSVAYLGQPFTDGTFSFTSDNSINNSELLGENNIDLYKPEVGKRRKDVDSAMNIPLKAALYVLKDKNDQVSLDIPVSGNIDSPEFSYMKMVWKTLGNLLVKVATSPLNNAAKALGIKNSGNMEFLPVEVNQQDLTSEQFYVLDQLSKIANYDTTIIICLEHQLGRQAADSSAILTAQSRNNYVMQHMMELGVREEQIEMSISPTPSKKSGYAISSKSMAGTQE